MGLSNTLQTFDGLPQDAAMKSPLEGALDETVGFLEWFESTYAELFKQYPVGKNRMAPYEKNLLRIENLLTETEVSVQTFADLIVPYALLPNDGYHLRALSAVLRSFYAAGSLLVISMAGGRAIRGGIEAESAVERAPGELYGRALNDALALEMRAAGYPRIVVGKKLQEYLKRVARPEEPSFFTDHAKALAEKCLRLLFEDADGQLAVHYLSAEFQPPSMDSAAFTQARVFIAQQLSYWATAGPPRLAEKYQRLDAYWRRFYRR